MRASLMIMALAACCSINVAGQDSTGAEVTELKSQVQALQRQSAELIQQMQALQLKIAEASAEAKSAPAADQPPPTAMTRLTPREDWSARIPISGLDQG